MKKSVFYLMLLVLAAGTAAAQPAEAPSKGNLVFLGNSGWLVTLGSKKALIDAPFTVGAEWGLIVPPAETNADIAAGRAPFDRLDLVLISHNHEDHYATGPLLACLEKNPGAAFIAPPDVVRRVKAAAGGRALANKVIDPALERGKRAVLDVNGVTVEIFAGSHHYPDRQGVLHYAFRLSAGGGTVFHSSAWIGDHGDEIDRSRWPGGPAIDAALLHYYMVDRNTTAGDDTRDDIRERRRVIKDLFRPRLLVLHHVYEGPLNVLQVRELVGKLKADFPAVVVPGKCLEEMSF